MASPALEQQYQQKKRHPWIIDDTYLKVIPFRNATDRNLQNIHRFQLIGIKNASSFAAEKALIHIGSPIISRSNRRFDRPLYIPARVYKNFDFTPSLAECIQGQFCSTFLIIGIQGYVFSLSFFFIPFFLLKWPQKAATFATKWIQTLFFFFPLFMGYFKPGVTVSKTVHGVRIPLPLLYVTGFRYELSRAFFHFRKAYKYGLFCPSLRSVLCCGQNLNNQRKTPFIGQIGVQIWADLE